MLKITLILKFKNQLAENGLIVAISRVLEFLAYRVSPNLVHRLFGFFVQQHLFATKTTEREKVLQFLDATRPLKTEHKLIRTGGELDGGYLIPDDMDGVKYCFSPGVSSVADFENDLAKRGIKSFLADYSVNGPPVENELFDFEKNF